MGKILNQRQISFPLLEISTKIAQKFILNIPKKSRITWRNDVLVPISQQHKMNEEGFSGLRNYLEQETAERRTKA